MTNASKDCEGPSDDVFDKRSAALGKLELFAEGDFYPPLNKKIDSLQAKDTDFIVFLDREHRVEWEYTSPEPKPRQEEFERRVLMLQYYSCTLVPDSRRPIFGHTLGRAMAACMAGAPEEADKAVRGAMGQIIAEVRMAYMSGAALALGIAILFLAVGWATPDTSTLRDNGWLPIYASFFAAFTAFVSASQRQLELKSLSKRHYVWEGILRVFLGVVSAGVVLVLYDAELVHISVGLGERSPAEMFSIAAVAGFSEKLLPQLLGKHADNFTASVDAEATTKKTTVPDEETKKKAEAARKKAELEAARKKAELEAARKKAELEAARKKA